MGKLNILEVSKRTYRNRVHRATALRLRMQQLLALRIASSVRTNDAPFVRPYAAPSASVSPHNTPTYTPHIDSASHVHESEHDSDVEQPNDNATPSLLEALRHWVSDFAVQQTAVTSLLKLLCDHNVSGLPKDCRTLVQTPRAREVVSVSPGTYSHIGLFKALDVYMRNCTIRPDKLALDINIDGVPISASSNDGFWLILMSVVADDSERQIFVVGAYQGKSKPQDFSAFLMPFISEAKELRSYVFEGKSVEVAIRCVVCDAPARNSCLATKSHNGYYGCGRCSQKGVYRIDKHRMTFPDYHAPKRTNESFRRRSQAQHHHVVDSPFLGLDIDMVTQFPLDYLHTVCLGVVKKLLNMWIKGDTRSKIGTSAVRTITDRLVAVSQMQPSEFQRKCRGLNEVFNFKGTEFRSLILYILPVVTKDILADNKYQNLLFLHVALQILVDPTICRSHAHVAQKLLLKFVQSFRYAYGSDHLVYNVHSLLHIVDDVMMYGPLDSYSAFPFESYMSKVKKMLHKKNQTLPQLCNRVEESYLLYKPPTIKQHNVTFKKACKSQFGVYKEVVFTDFKIKDTVRDQWFMTNDSEIYKFDSCCKADSSISARKVVNKVDFFDLPIPSSLLEIYKSDGTLSNLVQMNISKVKSKIFAMPLDGNLIFAPLRHTNK